MISDMGTALDIAGVLGPEFRVRPASDLWGIDFDGWIVTHRKTGNFVYTGRVITIHEAANRLLRRVDGQDACAKEVKP